MKPRYTPLLAILLLASAFFGCAKVTQPEVTVSEADLTAEQTAEAGESEIYLAFDDPPELIEMVSPKYPDAAKSQGIEGKVVLQIVVDEKGNVLDPKVILAIPKDLFEEAALAAVKQWKFKPAEQNGRAVKVYVGQNIEFTLRSKPVRP